MLPLPPVEFKEIILQGVYWRSGKELLQDLDSTVFLQDSIKEILVRIQVETPDLMSAHPSHSHRWSLAPPPRSLESQRDHDRGAMEVLRHLGSDTQG